MPAESPAQSESESSPPFFAGIDVGGTNIKLGIVDNDGATIAASSFPTCDERGPADAIERMAVQLDQLITTSPARDMAVPVVGLGTPGTMDLAAGMILEPPNLPGWRHFPIRDGLSNRISRPVVFANDANAAAYGEYWVGQARAVSSMVLLTLGTGVGGGVVIEDQLIQGATGNGGECGHVAVDFSPQARVCSCGMPGHLEAYASASAVARRAAALAVENSDSTLGRMLRQGSNLTAKVVGNAAAEGDPLARQIVFEAADYLARAITMFANVLDPDAVLLGGAMDFGGASTPLGQEFLARIREKAKSGAIQQIAEHLEIEFASLGASAGWIGAAGLAKRHYDHHQK